MPLTPEQEWSLVACGVIAHADQVMEVGEWDHILRVIDARLSEGESREWIELLSSREALEGRLRELPVPLPHFARESLAQAWRIALADGAASQVEHEVHDTLAIRAGIEIKEAAAWRADWTRTAAERAEVVAGFAAAISSADGRTDPAEAAAFDSLIERLPLAEPRRELVAGWIWDPPPLDQVGDRLAQLEREERDAVLQDLVPLVLSGSGSREADAFFSVASRAAIPHSRAEAILKGRRE